jgi:hypothetical protein
MSSVPISPKLQKGAIVAIDSVSPAATMIVFQYNPETLSRTVKPRWMESASKAEVSRLTGAPEEEIKVDIELDATDNLETGDIIASTMGIYPQLAALEMLVYPKTTDVIKNTALLLTGTMEIIPPSGPFTLFVWGLKRVLPVKINDLSITEELHDPNLNPIRAKVSLGMKVLSYTDLSVSHPGYGVFLAHQVIKEAMAKIGAASPTALGSVIGI